MGVAKWDTIEQLSIVTSLTTINYDRCEGYLIGLIFFPLVVSDVEHLFRV